MKLAIILVWIMTSETEDRVTLDVLQVGSSALVSEVTWIIKPILANGLHAVFKIILLTTIPSGHGAWHPLEKEVGGKQYLCNVVIYPS